MAMKKTIVEPSWEAKYSFSPAVITEGGKTIWLAGHVDDTGASLAGNFDAQTRQAFKNLERTLQRSPEPSGLSIVGGGSFAASLKTLPRWLPPQCLTWRCTSRTRRPVLRSYQKRLNASVAEPSCTTRLPDRSSGSASPRFYRHRRN